MQASLRRCLLPPAAALSAGLAATGSFSSSSGDGCGQGGRGRGGWSGGAARADTGRDEVKRVAFLGNSYLYFNDVPRVFQFLCKQDGEDVHIKDCLRGGSSFRTLLEKGNGMRQKFKTQPALRPDGSYDIGAPSVKALLEEDGGWHFVVMNSFSQEAAIPARREEGLKALQEMAPMIERARACPVLLVTPAYRAHTKGSEKIGSWEEFAWKQGHGYRRYARQLLDECPDYVDDRGPRLADVNAAFQLVRGEEPELWRELYYEDDFHPSALGSFLEACVIYCAIFGRAPPLPERVLADPSQLFARSRRMLPPPEVGRLPSRGELLYLRSAAMRAWSCDERARI